MKDFETYNEISEYTKINLISNEPTCFNGMVRVRRYKVSVELIDEDEDIIRARIQKLWDECSNTHNWDGLKSEAKKYGLKLSFETQNRR